MRITIEVDLNAESGNAPAAPPSGPGVVHAATFDVPDEGPRSGSHASGALDAGAAADDASAAEQGPPADLLLRAAALNALSAGRAPDLSAAATPVPAHPAHPANPAHAPGPADAATAAADPVACGMASGQFDGITNAGGPPPGSGVDAL